MKTLPWKRTLETYSGPIGQPASFIGLLAGNMVEH